MKPQVLWALIGALLVLVIVGAVAFVVSKALEPSRPTALNPPTGVVIKPVDSQQVYQRCLKLLKECTDDIDKMNNCWSKHTWFPGIFCGDLTGEANAACIRAADEMSGLGCLSI
jgi:hypothetical protein